MDQVLRLLAEDRFLSLVILVTSSQTIRLLPIRSVSLPGACSQLLDDDDKHGNLSRLSCQVHNLQNHVDPGFVALELVQELHGLGQSEVLSKASQSVRPIATDRRVKIAAVLQHAAQLAQYHG
jgi:hypothetical protein